MEATFVQSALDSLLKREESLITETSALSNIPVITEVMVKEEEPVETVANNFVQAKPSAQVPPIYM